MYENQTFETIIERMRLRAKELSDIDTSEGSLIYNILAPEAWELSEAYVAIDEVLNCTFADTAPREELILRASERGIKPHKATCSTVKAEFNIDIPIGSRFTIDDLAFVAIEKIDNCIYGMMCEVAGTSGNKKIGELIPTEYIDGLETAKLTEVLIPGTNEEETEAFRKRYFGSFTSQAFGGNRADYKQKIKSINGVGGVKLQRITKEQGTILATIISSEYLKPSLELVNKVQTTIDPTKNSGEGEGLAPIGHIVKIKACDTVQVNLTLKLVLKDGYVLDDVKEYVIDKVKKYFLSLRREWENTDQIIIRNAHIISSVLQVLGVDDVAFLKINEKEGNHVCFSNEIPILGDVTYRWQQ